MTDSVTAPDWLAEPGRLIEPEQLEAMPRQGLLVVHKIFDRALRMVLSRPSQFIEGISEHLLEPMSLDDEERDWGWES